MVNPSLPNQTIQIVIVDDDHSIQQVAADIFTEMGFAIQQAYTVHEARQVLQTAPDLVLCDVMLPDGNGYDVLAHVQQQFHPMPPFIFMSGEAILHTDVRKGMRSGADDYLTKPFQLSDLVETVQARLTRHRELQQNLEKLKAGPALPAYFSGTEPDLLTLLEAEPPAFLLALRLEHHERFQRIFGREGARLLCHALFERFSQLPICQHLQIFASDVEHQIYVLPQVKQPELEALLIAGLQTLLASPFVYDRYRLHLQVSQGWVYPEQVACSASEWVERANLALYQSRLQGGGVKVIYHAQMSESLYRHFHWEDELQLALAKGRFEVFYQPQFELGSRKVVALEALLRLRLPEVGLVPPAEFIPVAEESGLIVPIGNWVLRQSCEALMRLHQLGYPLRVAVNVSLLQFQSPDFVPLVAQTLAETGMAGRYLELELTESLLVHNFREVEQWLKGLKALGVSLAVDDFGTGYSSLFYLNQLPFDLLKIDQSFVRGLRTTQPSSLAIPRAIVEMGHSMKMDILAEGIEEVEQLQLLDSLGCDFGQGYLISRPLPEAELLTWLQQSVQ